MNDKLGLTHFWAQGDAVSHAIAILLLMLSVTSWMVTIGQLRHQLQLRRAVKQALPAFWQAGNRPAALAALSQQDTSGVFTHLAREAEQAAHAFAQQTSGGLGGTLDVGEFLGRSLQQAITHAHARSEQGLTFLASVGSTAPFIGLFGTVWGIYHALIGLTGAGRNGANPLAIDQIAGPVGEALIMTAVGLFVAIPAVLAYNASTRSNRLLLAQLDGFAHSLHAYLVAGIRLESAAVSQTTQQRAHASAGA